MKYESGVHRVQRVPATETQGRVHTSAASVAVLPEAEEFDVVINEGEIKWDTTKPNGTPRKLLDVSKAEKLGWHYMTELEDGIRLAYEDFLNNPMRAER